MRNKKGFTLSELLIVVAIIGVLVAISIPIFTSQLHKAEVATDWANLRGFYAELQTDYMKPEKREQILQRNMMFPWERLRHLQTYKAIQ